MFCEYFIVDLALAGLRLFHKFYDTDRRIEKLGDWEDQIIRIIKNDYHIFGL